MSPLLGLVDITVRFGMLTANDEVCLAVEEGDISALIGPNGAGKTTLFNVVAGAQEPTSGRVSFDGRDVTNLTPVERARLGISRTFQNLSIAAELTVIENVMVGLGRFWHVGLIGSMLRLPHVVRRERNMRSLAMSALSFVGMEGSASRVAGDLPYGDRRRLEVARALALGPRLLLLDEPSAGMGPAETMELAQIIRDARREMGVAVLVVEHDMSFVRLIADNVTALEFGRVIASGDTDTVLSDPIVVDAYLGKAHV